MITIHRLLSQVSAIAKLIGLLSLTWVLLACDSEVSRGVEDDTGKLPSASLPPVDLGTAAELATVERWYKPDLDSRWQWQLQGIINTSYAVDVYDLDLFDTSIQIIEQLQSQGRHIVCYFSAGTFENWRTDAGLFPAAALGAPLADFPAERWLDIRSAPVRQALRARLELAKQKGCDAVEPDNVDAYTYDSGFALTAADQLNFNRWLATTAHEFELGIGLKNDTDQVLQLLDVFDFVVSEQCFEYNECERYTPFIKAGKPVFNTEYPPLPIDDASIFTELCHESARLGLATLIMPLELDDRFRIDCADIVASN